MALGFLGGKRRTIDNLNVGSINSGDDLRDSRHAVAGHARASGQRPRPPARCDRRRRTGKLKALLVQPLFGAAIAVLVHVGVAYAHVAILILALPGGFFGELFGIPYNAESHSRGRR